MLLLHQPREVFKVEDTKKSLKIFNFTRTFEFLAILCIEKNMTESIDLDTVFSD